jgi:hypothetical protein
MRTANGSIDSQVQKPINPDPELALGFKQTFVKVLNEHSHRSRSDIADALAVEMATYAQGLYELFAEEVKLHGISAVS